MRLFLSSFRLNDTSRELRELAGAGARAAVVLNALDNVPGFPRADRMEAERRALAALSLRAFELDLRDCVGRPDALRAELDGVGLVWATGGNVFVLREAMRRSGLDAVLHERLREDTVAYGGYSAGACVAGLDAARDRARRRRRRGKRAHLGRTTSRRVFDCPALPLSTSGRRADRASRRLLRSPRHAISSRARWRSDSGARRCAPARRLPDRLEPPPVAPADGFTPAAAGELRIATTHCLIVEPGLPAAG